MQIIRRVIFYAVLSAGTLLIVATLLSLVYDVRFWYIKALDFSRVQVLLGLLVCLVVFLAVNRRYRAPSALFLLGLMSSVVLQARLVLPYTPLADEAVEGVDSLSVREGSSLSLLVANVWMENERAGAFLDLLRGRDPDVVLAMETDERWLKCLAPLRERYPYRVLYPLGNTYGMALYSRLPLENAQIRFLSHDKVPSIHADVRLPGGGAFRLHAVHPVPPKPSEYPDNVGEKEVDLLKVGEMVERGSGPTVVAGDFNDVAWSRTSRLFGTESRLGDVRVGRGLYNSFDATSRFMRWPLDHIYVSEEFWVARLERLPAGGSDHFPIFVRLVLTE